MSWTTKERESCASKQKNLGTDLGIGCIHDRWCWDGNDSTIRQLEEVTSSDLLYMCMNYISKRPPTSYTESVPFCCFFSLGRTLFRSFCEFRLSSSMILFVRRPQVGAFLAATLTRMKSFCSTPPGSTACRFSALIWILIVASSVPIKTRRDRVDCPSWRRDFLLNIPSPVEKPPPSTLKPARHLYEYFPINSQSLHTRFRC